MVKRGPSRGTRAGEGFNPDTDVDFAGKYPNTMAEIAAWTGVNIWNIGWNFTSLTAATPNTCPSMSGGASRTLGVLSGGSPTAENAIRLVAPQDGFAAQGGVMMDAPQKLLFVTSPEWALDATLPCIYLFRVRFNGAMLSATAPFAGLDGLAGGFSIQCHATSGIRALIGNGVSYVGTSYIGGTSLYDGEWQTIALAVDLPGGKAKLICESASTESTGLTIVTVSSFCTLGATYKGDTYRGSLGILLAYRGEHADCYTDAETIFDAFEAARIAGGA